MNPMLSDYLRNKKYHSKELSDAKKNQILIQEGLFTKEYSNEYSGEYSFSDGNGQYYKRVPIEVTDEEFQEIMKYVETTNEHDNNKIGTAMKVVAILIFIAGFILGIVFGNQEIETYYSTRTEYNFGITAIYWVIFFVSGMFFLGISEIIELLNDIKNNI